MAKDELDDETLRRILAELDPAFDPVPDDLVRISEELFSWRSVDADLAELESSSELSAGGVRASAAATRLTYVHGEDEEIVLEFDAAQQLLLIDLGGSWASEVTLRRPDAADRVAIPDDAGVCRLTDVMVGPAQLVIRRSNGTHVKVRPFVL